MCSATYRTPPAQGPLGILIVEDEQVTALELHNRLSRLGYRITGVTSSGEDALASIEVQRPDLILMDIVLAGKITGIETAAVVHQQFDVPIVYLSAYSDAAILEQVKGTDSQGFLTKPFRPEALHAAIEVALSRHQKEQVRRESERCALQEASLQSKEQIEQFAYTACHDLKEPLRTARAFVDLLAKRTSSKLDEEERQLLREAQAGLIRLKTLLDDLIAYAQAGFPQNETVPNTPSNTVLRRALENLREAIAESGAKIVYDDLPTVPAHPLQLLQVFQNLLSNAIKYQNVGNTPQVQVGAEKRVGEVVFWVKDNGLGFEPEYAEDIFCPFRRLHGQSIYPGTGIGLAICRKIIEAHGGKIWAEAKPGHGAAFFFTLPDRS